MNRVGAGSLVGAGLLVAIVSSAALAFPQTRHEALYSFTSQAGVRGEPVDIVYDIAAVTGSTTAEGSDDPIRIAVAGDVGTGQGAELATAASMNRVEGDVEYDALLLLGDNVYPDGDPAEVQRTVLEPFAAVLDGGTALLPVLGNHDNDQGYGDEQADALGMPGRWYATRFGDVLIVSLDSNHPDDTDQLRWLEDTLSSSTERWKIVEFHHPPYSGGWHGSDERVRRTFVPLFERFGVQLVLAGHDHDYQRSSIINGVTYVVSGAAAELRDANLADFTEIAQSIYHFVDLTVWTDHIDVRAIGHDDHIFDQFAIQGSETGRPSAGVQVDSAELRQ